MNETLKSSTALVKSMKKLMPLCSDDTILRAMDLLKGRAKEQTIPFYTRIKDLQTEEEILAVIEDMERGRLTNALKIKGWTLELTVNREPTCEIIAVGFDKYRRGVIRTKDH